MEALKYENHDIPEVRVNRQYIYGKYQQIATMTLPQIGIATVNPESSIGAIIRDNILLSSVISEDGDIDKEKLTHENLFIIRGICQLIEVQPSFEALKGIEPNVFPQDIVEKIKASFFHAIIINENENENENEITNTEFDHKELISDDLDQDEDF